nr:ORF98 [Acipenserid herpesvirus 1]
MDAILNLTTGCLYTLKPLDLDLRKIPLDTQRELLAFVRNLADTRHEPTLQITKPQWMSRGNSWYYDLAFNMIHVNIIEQRTLFTIIGACLTALKNGLFTQDEYLQAITFILGLKSQPDLLRQYSDLCYFSPSCFVEDGQIRYTSFLKFLVMLFSHQYLAENNITIEITPRDFIPMIPFYSLTAGEGNVGLLIVEPTQTPIRPIPPCIRICFVDIDEINRQRRNLRWEIDNNDDDNDDDVIIIENNRRPRIIINDDDDEDEDGDRARSPLRIDRPVITPPFNRRLPNLPLRSPHDRQLFGAGLPAVAPNMLPLQMPLITTPPIPIRAVNSQPIIPVQSQDITEDEIKKRTVIGMLNQQMDSVVEINVVEGEIPDPTEEAEIELKLEIKIPGGIAGRTPYIEMTNIYLYSCCCCYLRKQLCYLDCCRHTVCVDCFHKIENCPHCRHPMRFVTKKPIVF